MPDSAPVCDSTSAPQDVTSAAPLVEFVKGNLSPIQRQAVEKLIGEVARAVDRQRNARPDSRGHFGYPQPQPAANTANPTGFRSAPIPRQPVS